MRINLQPAAAPVDTFAPAEVRASAGGSLAAQTAQALIGFNQNLQGVLDRRFDEHIANTRREAAQIVQANAIKNMSEFRRLVDDGKIQVGDNPWTKVFIEQLVGVNEVRDATRAARQEWESSADRWQDDPSKADAFFDSKVGSLANGRSPFQAEAMIAEATQAKQAFLNDFVSKRVVEREQEAEVGITTQLGQTFRNLQPLLSREKDDPTAVSTEVASRIEAFNNKINSVRAIFPPDKLRQILARSIATEALSTRDYEGAARVLNSLQVGGEPVIDKLPPAFLTDLREKIADARDRDISEEYSRDVRQEEIATKAALRTVMDQYYESKRKGTSITADQFEVSLGDISDPIVREKVRATMAILRRKDVDQVVASLAQKEVAGNVTEQDRLSTYELAMAIDPSYGAERIGQIRQVQNAVRSGQWGDMDADASKTLFSVMMDPTASSREKVDVLMSLQAQKRIPENTFHAMMERAYTPPRGGDRAQALLQVAEQGIRTRLFAALRGQPGAFLRVRDGESSKEILSPTYDARIGTQLTDLLMEFHKQSYLHPEWTEPDVQKFLTEQQDKILSNLVGMTASQVDSKLPLFQAQQAVAQGDYRGNLRWQDGQLFYTAGSISEPAHNPQVFQSPKELMDSVAATSVLEGLGMSAASAKDKQAFILSQARAYFPESVPQLEAKFAAAGLTSEEDIVREINALRAPMQKLDERLMELSKLAVSKESVPNQIQSMWDPAATRMETRGLTADEREARRILQYRYNEAATRVRELEARLAKVRSAAADAAAKKAKQDAVNKIVEGK